MALLVELLDLLAGSASSPYIGEPVAQLEHALQAAALAAQAGASDALVAAALLHDVGHLLPVEGALRMANLGVLDHETRGAVYLGELGFGREVVGPIADHVRAKRYLVAKRADYYANLSAASRATLVLQGGAMSSEEAAAFAAEPGARDALRLRAWDEQAKIPGRTSPGLETYRRLLERLVARA